MEEKILEALERNNKWWKGDFEVEFKPRDLYLQIKKFMHTRQIIAITGLRRVGKTTIMFKLVKDTLQELNKENIVYFSFDEFRNIDLKLVLRAYARLMSKNLLLNKYLFLLDEVQKLENWEEQLKVMYDSYPNIKFVISGSESLFIRKKSRESLAGRMYEFHIKPLSFREFLLFKNKKFDNLQLYKEEILREFKGYIACSGFPEIVNEGKEIVNKYIQENVIEKIIYKDIPQIFPVKEPAILEQAFKIILLDPGEIIIIEELARDLGVSRQTLSAYLDYLEKAYLIKKIYNFSKNVRKTQKRAKKYYPTIILPLLAEKSDFFGKVFETFLVMQLEAEYFWRDGNVEVDIIKITDESLLPIEIKVSKVELKGLKSFMKKFNINKGLIITYEKKTKIDLSDNVVEVIPFYEYLLKQD